MNEYTIAEVKSIAEAQFGSKRISFTVVGNPNSLSMFTKYPEKIFPGAKITGEITTKETGGKIYHNFVFPKKDSDSSSTGATGASGLAVLQTMLIDVLNALRRIEKKIDSNDDSQPNFDVRDQAPF